MTDGRPITGKLPALAVRLVGPNVWQEALRAAGLSPGLDASPREILTAAILNALHDRHVGITPHQALGLADLLQNPNKQARAAAPWEAGLRRLRRVLQANVRLQTHDWQGIGFVLAADPVYTIFRLALPWIERSVAMVGTSWLFCADEIKDQPEITLKQYLGYAANLTAKAVELAVADSGPLDLFWQDRANTLASRSQSPWDAGLTDGSNRADGKHADGLTSHPVPSSLPDPDHAALAFFYRLTDPPEEISQYKSLKRSYSPVQMLKIRQRREGGMAGLRVSHSIDEIDQMAPSELVNPPEILADRLLNTGFLAYEREPRRQKMRDLLVTAILPFEVTRQGEGDSAPVDTHASNLLKACWFNCMTALGEILLLNRLRRSEFRIIEGDVFGRMRTAAFRLEWLAGLDGLEVNMIRTGPMSEDLFRQKFLNNLHWIPAFLDRRRVHQLVPSTDLPVSQMDERLSAQINWVMAAWRSQKDLAGWGAHAKKSGASEPYEMTNTRLPSEKYAYVHVMVFLPAYLWEKTIQTSGKGAFTSPGPLAELTAALGMGRSRGNNLSLTWVPARLDVAPSQEKSVSEPVWAFSARGHPDMPLFNPGQPAGVHAVAQKLEQLWIDQILHEVQHG